MPQLKSPHAATKTQHSQINKYFFIKRKLPHQHWKNLFNFLKPPLVRSISTPVRGLSPLIFHQLCSYLCFCICVSNILSFHRTGFGFVHLVFLVTMFFLALSIYLVSVGLMHEFLLCWKCVSVKETLVIELQALQRQTSKNSDAMKILLQFPAMALLPQY